MSRFGLLLVAGLLAVLVLLVLERGRILRTNDQVRRDLQDAQREVAGLQQAAHIAGELLAARDALDLKHTQELNDERDQNARLRAAVDAGRQRLRVQRHPAPQCPPMPAPPAWLMQEPPNSLQRLDRIISPSATNSP